MGHSDCNQEHEYCPVCDKCVEFTESIFNDVVNVFCDECDAHIGQWDIPEEPEERPYEDWY